MGTSKQVGGGERVNTTSQLGCSTSVALATGPTDEEEWREPRKFGNCWVNDCYHTFIPRLH